MFKIVHDVHLEETIFNCSKCGQENSFFREDFTPIYCAWCNKVLSPRVGGMLRSQLCRIDYHFDGEQEEQNGETKGKVYSCSYSPY